MSSKSTHFVFHLVIRQILQQILSFVCSLTCPSLFFADKWNTRITDLRKEVEELFKKKYGKCSTPFQAVACSPLSRQVTDCSLKCILLAQEHTRTDSTKGLNTVRRHKSGESSFLDEQSNFKMGYLCLAPKCETWFYFSVVLSLPLTYLGQPHLRELSFSVITQSL